MRRSLELLAEHGVATLDMATISAEDAKTYAMIGLRRAPVSDRRLQRALTVPGDMFGLPTGQPAGTAQFLKDVASGDENPQSADDWTRRLIVGLAAKKAAGGR